MYENTGSTCCVSFNEELKELHCPPQFGGGEDVSFNEELKEGQP